MVDKKECFIKKKMFFVIYKNKREHRINLLSKKQRFDTT